MMSYRPTVKDCVAGALFLVACVLAVLHLADDNTANMARSARRSLATEWRAASDLVTSAGAFLPPLELPTPAVPDLDAPGKERGPR